MTTDPGTHDYDVIVVGSGFGGSVTALRLSDKGYRVAVLEAGRRFADDEFARTSWDVRKFLWAPRLGCFGIQRIHRLPDVTVLAGAGVGGGSLVYANTLYPPDDAFYDDPQWREVADWRAELAPHLETARRMLGVVTNPTVTPSDEVVRQVAQQMGVGDTFRLTPVGVFFGEGPGVRSPDPFFGGAGPERTGCLQCGSCMTGCRYGAKNTLPKNYLWLAERAGAEVLPLTTVTALRPLADGWAVDTVRTGAWRARRTARTVTAGQVVLAAGTYGTQRLLHRMRDTGRLRNLSPRLGELTRTNSESLLGATTRRRGRVDYSSGVAITSSFRPEPETHVEPVRYGAGSNLMGLLSTVLTEGGGPRPRALTWLTELARHPARAARTVWVRGWSQRTVIALVMQSLDNSLVVSGRRGLLGWRLTSRHGHGEPSPTWIPAGNEAVRRMAAVMGGEPGGSWLDLTGSPVTAHFLGGVTIGTDAEHGVVDGWHRVFGHPGLHVADGSTVSANVGANPSLTITAQAERAMAFWPVRGEPDPRPPVGAPYAPVPPVAAAQPAVR
ncbi:MAG TPA: GMC family oxidoreductase [Actinomycetes bacterium]|nr:GMC family oxidoreductase [Actinomycetes bacterium]